MQRFLAIGDARLHVLEAGVHDPREAERITRTLSALRPSRLWFDLSGPEWVAILQGRPANRFARTAQCVAAQCGASSPDAVYQASKQWADQNHVAVRFLLDEAEPPRRRDLWRLHRLLRREGFEAPDPTAAVRRLHVHYVSRVPGLQQWLDRRWSRAARNLAAAERSAGSGGLIVCGLPDGEGIADRVQYARGEAMA